MLAVVELGGNQFMVQKGDIIEVKKQDVFTFVLPQSVSEASIIQATKHK